MQKKKTRNTLARVITEPVSRTYIRTVSTLFATAVLLLSMNTVSHATTYTSSFDPIDFQPSYTFDLTTVGFDPVTEVIDSAVVTVFVRDLWSLSPYYDQVWSLWVEDNDSVTERSSYFDGHVAATIRLFDYTPIETDGTLDFGVTPSTGVYIGASTLTVTTSAAVVPVPAAVWLFGSGLIGLIGVARRKKA